MMYFMTLFITKRAPGGDYLSFDS